MRTGPYISVRRWAAWGSNNILAVHFLQQSCPQLMLQALLLSEAQSAAQVTQAKIIASIAQDTSRRSPQKGLGHLGWWAGSPRRSLVCASCH